MAQTLKQRVYQELKQKIISCEYPPGEILSEERICEAVGASRTPVREVLGRLEQEQLVTIHAKKGIKVNRVSLRNVNELFEARLRIEPYAVLKYGNRIRPDDYAQAIAYFRETDIPSQEMYERDDDFHYMFVAATENRYLLNFYSVVRDQVMRYRVLSDIDNRTSQSRMEHVEVATYCIRGNWEKAADAMRVHIENSKESIINYVLSQKLDTHNIFDSQTDEAK